MDAGVEEDVVNDMTEETQPPSDNVDSDMNVDTGEIHYLTILD